MKFRIGLAFSPIAFLVANCSQAPPTEANDGNGFSERGNAPTNRSASGPDCPSFQRLWNDRNWKPREQGHASGPPIREVRVGPGREMRVSDSADPSVVVTFDQLIDWLRHARELDQTRALPWETQLVATPGANCDQIERVARLIERTFPCGDYCTYHPMLDPPPEPPD